MTHTPAPLLQDLPVQSRGQTCTQKWLRSAGTHTGRVWTEAVEHRGRPLPLNRKLEQVLQRG